MSVLGTNRESSNNSDTEMNMIDYWNVVWRARKSIVALVVAISIAAVVISLILPKKWRSGATIVPITEQKSGGMLSSLASQMGGLGAMIGMNLSPGSEGSAKLLVILKSRTLAENVIKKHNLMPILFADKWDEVNMRWTPEDPKDHPTMQGAAYKLKEKMGFAHDMENDSIKISGTFDDAVVAARIVNAYLEELQIFINENALTSAKRNRIFIERQLDENQREVLLAGKEINEFHRKNNVSSVEANLDVTIHGFQGKAEVQSKDGGKYANLAFGSPDEKVASDLQGLMTQKAQIEEKLRLSRVVEDIPLQVYLRYLMMRQELLAKVSALLSSQYEMAKIEESRSDLSFQVIDKAVPPEMRFSPKRSKICIMAFMGAWMLGIFLAFILEYFRKLRATRSS